MATANDELPRLVLVLRILDVAMSDDNYDDVGENVINNSKITAAVGANTFTANYNNKHDYDTADVL